MGRRINPRTYDDIRLQGRQAAASSIAEFTWQQRPRHRPAPEVPAESEDPNCPNSAKAVAMSCPPADAGRTGPRLTIRTPGGEYVVLPWSEIGGLTAQIEGWERAGGTHVSIVTMGRGLDSVDGHIDLLSTVADALGRPRPSSSQT